MYKISFIFLLVTVVLCMKCPAQISLIDSLKKRAALTEDGKEKLVLLQMLCRHSSSMPADTFRSYAQQALQLALYQQNEPEIWEAKYMYAFSLQQRSFTDSALPICDQLLKAIKPVDKHFALFHEVLGLKATCLKSQKLIKEGVSIVYQMLASSEKFGDTDGQINAYNYLTTMAGQLTNFDNPKANDIYLRKCITWYLKAIALFKDSSYYKKYDRILVNLGITYYQLPKSNYDSALYFIDRALVYANEQHQLRIMAACLSGKGSIFHDKNMLDSAEYYYKQEVAIEQEIGDPERIAISYTTLRDIYHERKDYKTALFYDIKERDYCIKNHVPIDPVQYVDFAQDYKGLGNYKAYGEMLDTLLAIKDSLYQANSAASLAEMQTKYEVEKKENTIIQQEYNIAKKRNTIYIITGLLLLLLVISFMTIKNREQKQRHRIKEIYMENERKTQLAVDDAKEDERKRIIADLHDDVGGGLSTIRMVSDLIAQQNEQTQQLNTYALKISSITKEVTQRMNTIVWALNADNNTAQNLIEYIREYGSAFFEDSPITFKCNLPEGAGDFLLGGLPRKNIFLCVKEALNNVYKHSGAKNAWINIGISDKWLTVAIHDDGKGFSNENPFGNGLKNIQRRMAEINGEFVFESSDGGAGIFLKISLATR